MYQQIQVDDRTWAFEKMMPDGDSVRFFVLNGDNACLVIDSGFLPLDIPSMVRELLKKSGRDKVEPKATEMEPGTGNVGAEEKPILLANTHADMDHTGGNAFFPEFYITQTDYDRMNLKESCPNSRMIPAEEGTTIDLGGRVLRYYMAPGHTYGNAVLLDETNRILFPGDMVQTGNMFMFGDHRCPEKMMESLEKLKEMNDRYDKIYACHGKIILPNEAVDEVMKAWEKVLKKEVVPVKKEVYNGSMVDWYQCGYCNFYYQP